VYWSEIDRFGKGPDFPGYQRYARERSSGLPVANVFKSVGYIVVRVGCASFHYQGCPASCERRDREGNRHAGRTGPGHEHSKRSRPDHRHCQRLCRPAGEDYSQAYLDASSPRSQQIKEQMERAGFQGPEAAQTAEPRCQLLNAIARPSVALSLSTVFQARSLPEDEPPAVLSFALI